MRKFVFLFMSLAVLLPLVASCSDENDDNSAYESDRIYVFDGIIANDSSSEGSMIVSMVDSLCVTSKGDTVQGYIYRPLDGSFFNKGSHLSLPSVGSFVKGMHYFPYNYRGTEIYNGVVCAVVEIRIATIEVIEQPSARVLCGVSDDDFPILVSRTIPDEVIYLKKIKLAMHFLRNADGSGAADSTYVKMDILKQLKNTFLDAKLNFELEYTEYIDYFTPYLWNNFSFDELSTMTPIFDMRPSWDVIHIFIKDHNPLKDTTAVAYSVSNPGRSIIVDASYADVQNTISHELGHCFGLSHTHRGTSRRVRQKYNLKEDIFGKGEAGVPEFVNGSNSDIAGDGITDTPADPNLEWNNNGYNGGDKYKDDKGDSYRPDKYNMMSYSPLARFFSNEQIKKMHYTILMDLPMVMKSINVSGPSHFSTNAIFTTTGGENITYWWKITSYSPASIDDSEPIINNLSSSSKSLNLSASGSQLFNIELLETRTGTHLGEISVTAGPPSPVCGTLFWKTEQYGTWEGSTTNKNWGSSLIVSRPTTIYLEYRDVTGASLSNLGYRTVTAAHRVLDGSAITVTASDCAQGFLKFRISDSCGQSSNYFTIPVSVVGSYFAVDFEGNNSITFSGKSGVAPAGHPNVRPKVPYISVIEIFDAIGKSVYKAVGLDVSDYTISTSGWKSGDYRAIISNGDDCTQEILFTI